MYDCILRNATIADGTGRECFRTDVALAGERIARIGAADIGESAASEIDCSGMVLAPGFIDMHSHTDLEFFRDAPPEAKIRQGVTTELLGQDGLGTAPVRDDTLPVVRDLLAGLDGVLPEEKWSWRTFGQYLAALEKRGLPNNVAVLLSHGPVRIESLGMDDRGATKEELAAMCATVRECMREGAFGLSTGLIYPPCPYGDTDELIALNREVAAAGGIFVVHQRDEGYYLSRSFDEVARISRESGAHLEISHWQAYGKVNWPLMDVVMEKAERFAAEGGGISWDRYPYLAGSTVLTAVLPTWTFSEGTAALIRNLSVPAYRERIREEFTKGLDVWHNRQISVGWENIVVTAVQLEKNRWMEGRSCQAIADRQRKNPVDAVMDLLAEEKLAVTMISFYGSDDIMDRVISHRLGTVGSDGIYGGRPHPRLYGAYPCYFRRFVREKKLLRLEEAVRKVTSYPASILGIGDRGTIAEGKRADLVLFDPETIADRATYEDPVRFPTGISHVFVNGRAVVTPDGLTGELPGQVLRRGRFLA